MEDKTVSGLATGAAFTTFSVVDIGDPGIVRLTFQMTQFVLDTETAGVGAGQISLNIAVADSMDGVTFASLAATRSFGTFDAITVGPQLDALYLAGRFLRFTASVWRNSALYAAARQPRIVGDLRVFEVDEG